MNWNLPSLTFVRWPAGCNEEGKFSMGKDTVRSSKAGYRRAVQFDKRLKSPLVGFHESNTTSPEAQASTPGKPSVSTVRTPPSSVETTVVGLSCRYSPPGKVSVSPTLRTATFSGQVVV